MRRYYSGHPDGCHYAESPADGLSVRRQRKCCRSAGYVFRPLYRGMEYHTQDISIEDIYKDSYDVNSPVITADEFPTLCFDNLVKLFYDASKIHYQHIENSLQISYIQKNIKRIFYIR